MCVYIYTHNGLLLNHKKGQNCAICRSMDGSRDQHTELSFMSEREKQNHVSMHICGT